MKSFVFVSLFAFVVVAIGQENHGHTSDAEGRQAGHVTTRSVSAAAKAWVGKPAPRFKTFDSSGAPVSLENLRQRPTVLVFIEKGCPCCKGGRRYYDRIQDTYRDVANVVGVVYGDQKSAAEWVKTVDPHFRVIADSDGAIARSFRVKSSLFTALIDRNGVVRNAYAGYSQSMLREITASIAQLAKIKDRRMIVKPAPTEITSGCDLGEHSK